MASTLGAAWLNVAGPILGQPPTAAGVAASVVVVIVWTVTAWLAGRGGRRWFAIVASAYWSLVAVAITLVRSAPPDAGSGLGYWTLPLSAGWLSLVGLSGWNVHDDLALGNIVAGFAMVALTLLGYLKGRRGPTLR